MRPSSKIIGGLAVFIGRHSEGPSGVDIWAGGHNVGNQSFTRGAIILATASAFSRLLGFVYIVVLPRLIYDQGMGLIQMVRPIYNFAVILSIAGLPVAISKLVAEQLALGSTRGALTVFRWALAIMLTLGTVFTGILAFGGRWLVTVIVRDLMAYPALMAMTPAVLILATVAAFRGLFQGLQYMTPTAVSQVTEQICRVTSMLVFAILLKPLGVEYGAAGASLGTTVGSVGGLVVIIMYYVAWRRSQSSALGREPGPAPIAGWDVLKQLFALSIPMVLGAILWPTMQMIDTGLVPLRMQSAGYSRDAIRESLGYLGMALSLMYLPNVLTSALGVTLVPAVAAADATGAHHQVHRRISEALRITFLFGLPSGVGLFCLAGPASHLVFGYPQVAAPLQILAAGTLSVGIFQVCSGVLQGLGLVFLPVKSLVFGVAVKFALNYYLTALPGLGIKGAAWGTVGGLVAACLLNLLAVSRHTGVRIDWQELLIKPLIVTLVMGLAVMLAYDKLSDLAEALLKPPNWEQARLLAAHNGLATAGTLVIGIVVYFIGLVGTGALYQRDVNMLPKIGVTLGTWLSRRGWVK